MQNVSYLAAALAVIVEWFGLSPQAVFSPTWIAAPLTAAFILVAGYVGAHIFAALVGKGSFWATALGRVVLGLLIFVAQALVATVMKMLLLS